MPDNMPTNDAAMPVELGLRLKRVRELNGLSQRELAKRAQVTHSSISMIEQGQNSPSINSLEKILSGIPMTLVQFFICDSNYVGQIVYRADELLTHSTTSSAFSIQTVPHKNDRAGLELKKMILNAGADTGVTPLISSKAITGFIISGQLELTANMQVSTLLQSDVFALSANTAYCLSNHSLVDDCVLLVCF